MSNIQVIQLAEYKQPIIKENNREEWVEYGENNDFFDFLIERHKKSTTNNAIINTITRLIYGKGLTALDANTKPNEYAQLITLISSDDVRKNLGELKLLGQCAIQVHYNKKRDRVLKAFHVPVNLLRAEKCNKDGEITGYYYSDNWQDVKKFQPKRLDAFGFGSGEIEILYVKPYSVGMKYYSNVDYQGALPYCTLEEEISDYLINLTQRRFTPTLLMNFNNGTGTPEQQDEVHRSIKNKFTGSKGEPYILSFNKNKDSAATIDSIQLDNAPEHYSFLSEECLRKIMLGHQVTSPLIFGIATTTGFSSNADELKNSLTIFDNLVIKPFQDLYLDAIEKILAFNGISLKLSFESLNPFEDRSAKVEDANTKETTLSEQKSELELYLDSVGEVIDENEWVIVDERDVDYNEEVNLDSQIEALNNPKKNLFQKLASAVKAIPNAKSEQDATIKGVNYKVRYKYYGNPKPERDFCRIMMNSNKLYRKEDLERVDSNLVNKGFGHNGEKYNVFLFAGGPRCKHFFRRVTFMSTNGVDVNSPLAKTISTETASKRGYKVTNPYQVGVQKNNLPNKGFHPDNKNLPIDAQ
ncbi:hypothetical protein UFOVP206_22 [uncultured Caudovirales phage]|uniref:Portal protein n=1 Tax=uncultured Caudovirales phage TaxID=2100421 RepID=A0A6J7WJ58_9CAUD|nr:hypothetical protein UFOVP206_22 [uncultured Caudovirales phage]